MRYAVLALIITLTCGSGCAALRTESRHQPPGDAASSAGEMPALQDALGEVGRLVSESRYDEAGAACLRIEQEHPGTDLAAKARYALALTLVAADNPQRDYSRALAAFDAYLSGYPQHERTAEARSWALIIKQLLSARNENAQLQNMIEKLKVLDIQQEEKRRSK